MFFFKTVEIVDFLLSSLRALSTTCQVFEGIKKRVAHLPDHLIVRHPAELSDCAAKESLQVYAHLLHHDASRLYVCCEHVLTMFVWQAGMKL